MRGLIVVAFISSFCISAPVAFGAGFDCTKAGSTAEKLICSDSGLSKADEILSDVYSRALASAGHKAEFKKEQTTWLRSERAPCRNKECLAAVYKKRIEVLSGPEPFEEYYIRERFPDAAEASTDDDEGKSDGSYYHVCVKVHGNPAAPLIDFEIYFPDADQSVTAELVRCKITGDGTLAFSFTDNWGNQGKGTFLRSGKDGTLSIEEVKPLDEPGRGRNALRNYGDYELTKGRCGSDEE